MSCNGCRILRKGCSENCSIRPCLQWIKSPESQANATVFLAKFYGRAGLMNLINAGPEHLRPGKSLFLFPGIRKFSFLGNQTECTVSDFVRYSVFVLQLFSDRCCTRLVDVL